MKEEKYGNYYNANYYLDGCGLDYNDKEYWTNQFGRIAREIVSCFSPKTFLDVGCAYGYLVAALRDLGVEAYGVDVSEYAISQVREDIRPYCYVCNAAEGLPEELPEFFDCISTVEVIEHLYEEDAQPFIKALCSHTNHIIFSSTPDDFNEPSHFNVQQREYWVKRFAREGFLRDMGADVSFLSKQALAFKREEKPMDRLIESYEHDIRLLNQKNDKKLYDKDVHIRNLEAMLKERADRADTFETELNAQKAACEQQKQQLQALTEQASQEREAQAQEFARHTKQLEKKQKNELKKLNNDLQDAQRQVENLRLALHNANLGLNHLQHVREHEHQLQEAYTAVTQSFFWRSTWPGRFAVSATKKVLKSIPGVKHAYTFLACMKDNGWKGTKAYYAGEKKAKQKEKEKNDLFPGSSLDVEDFAEYTLLKNQRMSHLQGPKISVVTPLFNTPIEFLVQMIDSVRNQTYENWELCLADGSDDAHAEVGEFVQQIIQQESRIRYTKLQENKGISSNTNKAIELATGDYIALFDHDDLLHPSALYYVAKEIKGGADFIYTDEMVFEDNIKNLRGYTFKSDFAIDTLRSCNYICHLTVFRKTLYDQVGCFDSEYDGSQDYDMVLRLTEKAEKIRHIPHVLYCWRAHSGSVAEDISVKSYCIDAAEKALDAHLKRVGLNGQAHLIYGTPGFYKIDYALEKEPLVSIIIPNKDQIEILDRCIDSIQKKSTYKNYEIVVVENNSDDEETFAYYETLKERGVRVEYYEGHFNYSAINNWAVKKANGEILLFLNNDIEVITPNWLQEMLMYAQRSDVGAVGAKLYYPNNTIQHAGVLLGVGGVAGHYHKGFERGENGYMGRLKFAQNVSAVTAACLMMKKSVFDEIGGFDESFEVAFNDVDLCLSIRKADYLIVFTPFAELYHYESISRGYETTPEKANRFRSEVERCQQKWSDVLRKGDPYYNINLTLEKEDLSCAIKPLR